MDRPEMVHDEIDFDQHGLIIAEDGTIDPANGDIGQHSPTHYARHKVSASVHGDRGATTWLGFLENTFQDQTDEERTAIVSTLQEWYGSILVREKPRATRMGLLVHGPSRTGKTQVAEVTRGLLGRRHVSGAQMRDLEGRFGVEPFLGRRGWIADDAIGEGEYLDADIYKKIVTGEKMSVQCKGGRNVETSFGFAVQLTANSLPRVKDQSEAVYNRSLILPCTHVRAESAPEPTGFNSIADKIIAEEMTGVLWWAFEGWQRLSKRGFFDPPKTMMEARKGFEADNNPVATWMAECLEKNPATKISRNDLLASMNGWWSQEYGVDAKPWSGRGFFPRLTKSIAGYSKERDETTDADGLRFLIGVELTQPGLLAWRIFKDSRWGQDSKTSTDEAFVNRSHYAVAEPSENRRPRF
jgi:P4 family phage/plasmid primase-like protien